MTREEYIQRVRVASMGVEEAMSTIRYAREELKEEFSELKETELESEEPDNTFISNAEEAIRALTELHIAHIATIDKLEEFIFEDR